MRRKKKLDGSYDLLEVNKCIKKRLQKGPLLQNGKTLIQSIGGKKVLSIIVRNLGARTLED